MRLQLLCLATAVAPTTPAYTWMAIGDWGASYTPPKGRLTDTCLIDPEADCKTHGVSGCGYNTQQQADGLQMGLFAAQNKVDHVMLLGDNFCAPSIASHEQNLVNVPAQRPLTCYFVPPRTALSLRRLRNPRR